MASGRCLVLLALLAGANALEVKPVEKVINLIEGLEKEVVDEGKAEATTYEKFACFCKDQSTKKSTSVTRGNDKINVLSADIGEKTQEKKDDATELGERKAEQEKLSTELDETTARCAKEKAAYEAEAADLSKAISSLNGAIKAMKTSGGSAPSLIALTTVVKSVSTTAAMTKASASTRNALAAFMKSKVDPNDPEYGYHSKDIIDLCENLLGEFKGEKSDLDTEYDKSDKACISTKKSLRAEMKSNKEAMDNLDKSIERLGGEIAKHREDLVDADSTLKDDELYLKDLTKRCEDRANDYDQRSSMRDQELSALRSALEILSGDVKGADAEANERALLQTPKASTKTAPSFLQAVQEHAQSLRGRADNSLDLEVKKNLALDMLRTEGRRIGSTAIAALTVRVAADPFKKVKGLIQGLIERLLEESANEATKKGFCDEALGSAEHDRESRFVEANDLSRKIKGLEATKDELTEEIDRLSKEVKTEGDDLKTATEDRESEKADNLKTLATAKEGLSAVTDALQLLKSFYSGAAKAASLLQASPVDEDTAGAGFSGSYKGKQGGMKAVFALLETIQSDFDRTLRNTEKAEKQAHREFVEFMQTSKSSSAGKSTKIELDEQDLESTHTGLKKAYADLQDTQDLLDSALQELEKLKPTCIDTGMSYKERVAKREEEIRALESALTILA